MPHETSWTCPACKAGVATPFCAHCGEEPIAPTDLSLRGLTAKLVHALTSIDARALQSAWWLVRHPGELTQAWTAGIRKPYVAPFQLFLLANVIFFAVQWLTEQNVFSSTLDSHLHHQDWSELAQASLSDKLAATGQTLAQYAPIFNRAVLLNAKALILLMAFAFALPLPLVFLRERRYFMTHVVFALHLYTFLLLVFCVALLLGKASALLGFGGLEVPRVDNVLTIGNLLACATYLHLAIQPVYGVTGVRRIAQTFLLTVVAAVVALCYRFALFFITLYTT